MKTIARIGPGIIYFAFLFMGYTSDAQKPMIRAIDKIKGSNGEVVTLRGSFNKDPSRISVSFGAVKGNVKFISDQLLEVAIPPGATYSNIVVTETVSGLSDNSNVPFLLSFGGDHGVTNNSLEGQQDFTSERGLYDLCLCDFDNDGKIDIATANNNSNTINIFANNTASPGLAKIAFNRISLLTGSKTIHAKCGDLNGDGKPDLVITDGESTGNRVFVFHNTSTGTGNFTFSVQSIKIVNNKVKRIELADLDNDGKPEIIVTNQSGNNITILVNESNLAGIIFANTPLTLTISGAASTDGLAVADLDNDGLPEIVTSQFLTPTSNIFILKNTSVPGNLSFAEISTLSLSGTVVNIKTGDLDGDQKPEIVVTQLLGSGITVFKNQSTTSPIFAAPVNFLTDERPWGIDFGDIDGDGMTDIVVASLTKKSVTILNNESTTNTLSFSALAKNTTFINRHVGIGDVDGDGKPDIIFTSVDDNNNNIPASAISVIRNKSCLTPRISPGGPITVCTGFPLRLNTTPGTGTTYSWKSGSTSLKAGPDPFLDISVSGNYSVTATGEAGSCTRNSNIVAVTVNPGITNGTAIPANDGPVCLGSTLKLSVNDVGGTAYNWSGPMDYTGSGLNPPPISNFQGVNAGRYFLDVLVGNCLAQRTSTVVGQISLPDFKISFTGSDVVCPPETKTLSLMPNDPDFSYQWAEKTVGNIAGATASTLAVTTSGQYFVKTQYLPNPACASIETKGVNIKFSTKPIADFNAPSTGCVGQPVTFSNQSTTDVSIPKYFTWTFGNSQSSTEKNPTHQFPGPGTFGVTLRVSYNKNACESQVTKNITIQSAPLVTITNPENKFVICEGDSLKLEAIGAFTSYLWSNNKTSSFIYVKEAGLYKVNVTTANCLLSASISVASLPAPVIEVMADPLQVNVGGSSQLSAAGLINYEWKPAETLSNPFIYNPIATPFETTNYTVLGMATNGCKGEATIEVSVKGDWIVNKLTPLNFFSPENGDAINDVWLIGRILDYPQCSVTIYDDKGIKVYESKPYFNDWNGTYKGKQLPDGVYFFIIRCDGEEKNPKSGSITILR